MGSPAYGVVPREVMIWIKQVMAVLGTVTRPSSLPGFFGGGVSVCTLGRFLSFGCMAGTTRWQSGAMYDEGSRRCVVTQMMGRSLSGCASLI